MSLFTPQKIKKASLLQQIQPLNLESERLKFMFDANYNPQFEYAEEIPTEKLLRHGQVHEEYLPLATKILDNIIELYGKESNFLDTAKGDQLNRDESTIIIQEFLERNHLTNLVKLSFSSAYTARTALKRSSGTFTLQIRTPVVYRSNSLSGMLNHEIGTHLFRWLNEMEQDWYERRDEFDLHNDYLLTEEGLATVNSLIAQPQPLLWSPALNYWLVVEGSRSSFSELNHKLKKYVDLPERRWRYCLKVKRGVEDTSSSLVFTKNQIYLRGAMLVLRWLYNNDYNPIPLYLGKISLADLPQAQKKSTHYPILPDFLQSPGAYESKLKEIILLNELESFLK
jgi:hypothetical protein